MDDDYSTNSWQLANQSPTTCDVLDWIEGMVYRTWGYPAGGCYGTSRSAALTFQRHGEIARSLWMDAPAVKPVPMKPAPVPGIWNWFSGD